MSLKKIGRISFDYFTASCFLLGICFFAAAGAADPARGCLTGLALFVCGACAAGIAALAYVVRFARLDWRPQRTTIKNRFMIYGMLVGFPCVATSASPLLALVIATGLMAGIVSYYAFKEAFTAAWSGFLSRQTMAWGLAIAAWILLIGRVGLTELGMFGETVVDFPAFAPHDWSFSSGKGFAQVYGSMLLFPIPTMMIMALSDSNRSLRWFWGVTAAALLVAIVLSYSRAAWLALATQVLALALLRRRSGGWWMFAVAAVAGTALVLAVPDVFQRLATLFDAGHATNVQRIQQWRVALDLLRESPFTGHGWGSFGMLYEMRTGVFYHWPHNLPLHIAVEGGIPALVVFVAWLLELRVVIRRNYGQGMESNRLIAFRDAAVATLSGLLMFGMFDW